MTCPLPCQTVQNGACYPECCEDEDCSGGLCDSGGSCQLGDCRRGSDCTGYNTLCHEPWQQGADNYEYCDNMDTNQEIGSCQPGCESSDHNMCPPANDIALEFMAVPILEQLFSRRSILLLDHVLGVVMTTLRVGLISMLLPQEQIVSLRILTIQMP